MRVDDPAAVRTATRCRNINDFVPLGRLRTPPAGMSHRSTPLFFPVHSGRCWTGGLLGRRMILAESLLALGLQLALRLRQLLSQGFHLCDQGRIASAFLIQLAMKHCHALILPIRREYQRAQTCAPDVRTMPDVRAVVLMFGVEDEIHRHPFRRNDAYPYAPD